MADSETHDGPPPFEDPFDSEDVEQQLYGTVLQIRSPTTAGNIAEKVGCDPKTARKYLEWFSELGIVTQHDGHPTTYERNDAYFEWRRINQLATEHTADELMQQVSELTATIERYQRRYDAETPGDVDALAAAHESDDRTVDDVYSDLGDWETARQERRLHERARQQQSGSSERVSG
jgi:predicted ArsR family transcriptional regulator